MYSSLHGCLCLYEWDMLPVQMEFQVSRSRATSLVGLIVYGHISVPSGIALPHCLFHFLHVSTNFQEWVHQAVFLQIKLLVQRQWI